MKSLKPNLKKIKNVVDKKATDLPRLVGVMGDGFGNLYSDTARTMVYVRFGENTKAIPVFNNRVPAENGLQVVVGATSEQPRLQQVLSTYSNKPGGETGGIIGGYAPAQRYEWLAPSGGQDPLYIHKRAITDLNVYVTKPPSMSVQLMRGVVRSSGVMIEVPQATYDHTANIPATAGKAVLVLHTINDAGANVQTVSSEFDIADLMPEGNRFLNMPSIPADTVFVRGLVRVYNGQAAVQEARTNNDIVDLRFAGFIGLPNIPDVAWSSITGIPAEFNPDTDVTDALYPGKYYKSVAPTVSDDVDLGYRKSDIWIDEVANAAYICIDNADGAANWLRIGSGGGGGTSFGIAGALSVLDNATLPILITADTIIESWQLYLETLGSSGSTIVDVDLIRVGEVTQSIFDDGVTDNRPEILYSDADNLLVCTPLITEFLAGDVLVINVDQVATGADTLILSAVAASSGGGGGGGGTAEIPPSLKIYMNTNFR